MDPCQLGIIDPPGFMERFQTLIVGAIVFAGVIATMITSARLDRRRFSEQVKHEREMMIVALRGELEVIKDAYALIIEQLANRERASFLVPRRLMTDTYDHLLDQIGLLSQTQVSAIMTAYHLVKQMPDRLLIIGSHDAGEHILINGNHFVTVRRIHEGYLEKINTALATLS